MAVLPRFTKETICNAQSAFPGFIPWNGYATMIVVMRLFFTATDRHFCRQALGEEGEVMRIVFWFIDLLLPCTMIGIGVYYIARKSKQQISRASGFRTAASMSSRENWSKAHLLAGKALVVAGCCLAVYAVVIKLAAPISAEWLSLLNNGIYIAVYILLTVIVNRRISP